jgi:hypothetical protein
MKFEVADETELKHFKDRAMMLKMLSLDKMGKNILADTSSFSKRDKIRLQAEIEKQWDDKDIVERFNELCIQTIFEDGKMDVEKLTVTQSGSPEIPEEEKEYMRKRQEENEKRKEEIVN